MAIHNISEEDQKKIAEKLKNFMKDEGITGEIELIFTKDFNVEDDSNKAIGPCTKIIGGRVINQNPCTPPYPPGFPG